MTTTGPARDAPTTPDQPGNQQPRQGPANVVTFPARRSAPGAHLPEAHTMPPSYEARGGAVFHVAERRDRKTGEVIDTVYTRVTYGPLAITRMCASSEGEQWFDLEWRDGARTVARRVDGAVLRSGRALVRELGAHGIPVIEADAKHIERYLAAYLTANRNALEETRVTIARHLGWQDDGAFVTANGVPYPVEPGQPEQKAALAGHHAKGTLDAWKNAVARVERYPVVRIALAAGFAPALLSVLRLNSFTVDISGRSSRGKSTAAGVGLSPWANPTDQGDAMATWKSTFIAIEKRLNLVRGLPVVLDETRVVKSPEIVDQVLYQVPMNRGAGRGGGYPSMLPWQTILISTGEQPALSFTSHEGAAARILSLRRAPFGLDGPRSAADARAVTEALAENYGTAGPAFAERLRTVLAEEGGAQHLRERHEQLRAAHAETARNDVARRRAPLVAALHLAAHLAHEWNIVPMPALPIEVWTELLGEESGREDRGAMALDVVRSLIAAQGHRLRPLNHQSAALLDVPAAGWIGAHVEHEGVAAVAILPEALAAALNRATPPITLDAVREAWAERGTIILDGKHNPRVRMDGGRPRAFLFARDVLDGDEPPPARTDTPEGAPPPALAPEPEPDTAPYEQTELGAAGWPKGSIGDLANR